MKTTSSNLTKLVNILNDGLFHDGSEMGKKLGITRSAVWKIIQKLHHYQIDIESVKSRGYLLKEPLILLDRNKIKKTLDNNFSNNIDLLLFENINSTNHYLKTFRSEKNIAICLAEYQESGKGRLSRQWHSPFGQNIYFSCRYFFDNDISKLGGLSLVVGLAMIQVLQKNFPEEKFLIKWPNDILWEQKKLAGILIEINGEVHDKSTVIIGIGLNVNMQDDQEKNIDKYWTSLRKISNQYIDRNKIVGDLINYLIKYLMRFQMEGFQSFIQEWQAVDYLTQRFITVKNHQTEVTGLVKGVTEQGFLLLELHNGEVKEISAGDTTIKQIK
jgi:BirA family biotin operon repressor/biotin-[acetyl-CoA-carboxylase] ligase